MSLEHEPRSARRTNVEPRDLLGAQRDERAVAVRVGASQELHFQRASHDERGFPVHVHVRTPFGAGSVRAHFEPVLQRSDFNLPAGPGRVEPHRPGRGHFTKAGREFELAQQGVDGNGVRVFLPRREDPRRGRAATSVWVPLEDEPLASPIDLHARDVVDAKAREDVVPARGAVRVRHGAAVDEVSVRDGPRGKHQEGDRRRGRPPVHERDSGRISYGLFSDERRHAHTATPSSMAASGMRTST